MTIDINFIHFLAFIALIMICIREIKKDAKELTGYLYLKGHNFLDYAFKIKCKIILRFAFIITFGVILYQSLFYVFWYIELFLKKLTCNI